MSQSPLWLLLVIVGPAGAAEWDRLTATFVYDGTPPKPAPVHITSDKEFCTAFHVVNESLVVKPQDNGLANVVVFPSVGSDYRKTPLPAPDAATEKKEVLLDNKHCRFDPHVVLLRTSQTLVVGNADAVGHNTQLATFRNPPVNRLIASGGQTEVRSKAEEPLPVKVACNIHPWMTAWLVVKDHPYMGVSDAHGRLEIRNLPAGEWTFQVWQEKAGFLRDVAFRGGKTDHRGRLTLTVRPGDNSLGEMKLSPTLFR